MRNLIVAITAFLLSGSALADTRTADQRRALTLMYDIGSIQSHCPITINFEKIDRDLSAIGTSIADFCPDGRFNAFAMPEQNESFFSMMRRLKGDMAAYCKQADRRFGPNGSERKGWLKISDGPAGEPSYVPLCTLDRP